MPFILEGLVATYDSSGNPHLAPMGPEVEFTRDETNFKKLTNLTLKPFETSQTLQNLLAQKCGAFIVTDQIQYLARGAINLWDKTPEFFTGESLAVPVLNDCCYWFEFTVHDYVATSPRTKLKCHIQYHGVKRIFIGYNRAQHAILELAILATRLNIHDHQFVIDEIERLRIPVTKTGGNNELETFKLLADYVFNVVESNS